MDEKLDEFMNFVNQKLVALEGKDSITSVASHSLKNSLEIVQPKKIILLPKVPTIVLSPNYVFDET